jgi:hypothetical protein
MWVEGVAMSERLSPKEVAALFAPEKKRGRIRVSIKAKRTLDGQLFASEAEMNRFAELQMLERAGLIEGLERQPRFELQLDKKAGSITYIADFRYRNLETNSVIVEDVKGMKTDVYKLKKKLFLARYPQYEFREIQV